MATRGERSETTPTPPWRLSSLRLSSSTFFQVGVVAGSVAPSNCLMGSYLSLRRPLLASVWCRCGVEREASSLWRHYGVLVVSLWRHCGAIVVVSLSRALICARPRRRHREVSSARGETDGLPAPLALRRWSRVAAARASPPLAARAWAGCVSPPTAEARARARALALSRTITRERQRAVAQPVRRVTAAA